MRWLWRGGNRSGGGSNGRGGERTVTAGTLGYNSTSVHSHKPYKTACRLKHLTKNLANLNSPFTVEVSGSNNTSHLAVYAIRN